jgi:hypothetical protein
LDFSLLDQIRGWELSVELGLGILAPSNANQVGAPIIPFWSDKCLGQRLNQFLFPKYKVCSKRL